MTSNQPETSVPQTSSDLVPESLNTSLPVIAVNSWVPHMFDLVTPTFRAHNTAKLHIPAVFYFVVEPARGLSALHLCALVPHGLSYAGSGDALTREDFDWETNRAIVHELLEWFRELHQLNLSCQMQGKTALHLAAEYGNVGVAEELVKTGADKGLMCEMEETPADIARRVFAQEKILSKLLAWLE